MSNFLEKANITGTSLNLKKKRRSVYYICLYEKGYVFVSDFQRECHLQNSQNRRSIRYQRLYTVIMS